MSNEDNKESYESVYFNGMKVPIYYPKMSLLGNAGEPINPSVNVKDDAAFKKTISSTDTIHKLVDERKKIWDNFEGAQKNYQKVKTEIYYPDHQWSQRKTEEIKALIEKMETETKISQNLINNSKERNEIKKSFSNKSKDIQKDIKALEEVVINSLPYYPNFQDS